MFFYINLLTALGYSLLNSVWQVALTWSFYYLLTDKNRRFTAAVRHDLLLSLCMVNVFWFIYGFVSSFNQPGFPLFPGFIKRETIQTWIPVVSMVYLLVLFCRVCMSGFRLFYHKKISFKPVRFIPAHWETFVNREARLLGISRKIRLFFSEGVETAETSGFLKPLILMPVSLITHLSPEQLETIIIHELLHIRRNDFLIHCLVTCYRHVFFFNPFADRFYQTLCHQRELACDDAVVARNISAGVYADALFLLEKNRQVDASFTVAADGHKPWLLRERIARLLGTPVTTQSRVRILPYAGIVIVFLLLSLSSQPIRVVTKMPVADRTAFILPVIFKAKDQSQHPSRIQVRIKQQPPLVNVDTKEMKELIPEKQLLNSNVEAENPYLMQYTDHREARNFSNESTMSIELPEKSMSVAPYIPEQSFEYNPETADELSDSLIQVHMKEVIAFTIIQKTAIKNQLKSAEKKLSSELKNIENRRKAYQNFNEKNFNQLVHKLQEQIEQKKVEIDRINIQSQTLDEEIIHI